MYFLTDLKILDKKRSENRLFETRCPLAKSVAILVLVV